MNDRISQARVALERFLPDLLLSRLNLIPFAAVVHRIPPPQRVSNAPHPPPPSRDAPAEEDDNNDAGVAATPSPPPAPAKKASKFAAFLSANKAESHIPTFGQDKENDAEEGAGGKETGRVCNVAGCNNRAVENVAVCAIHTKRWVAFGIYSLQWVVGAVLGVGGG